MVRCTCVYTDNIYRVYSDTTNFFIQRANPATDTIDWLNVAEFTYNTTTQNSYFYMNSIDILAQIASKTIDLTNLRTTLQQI